MTFNSRYCVLNQLTELIAELIILKINVHLWSDVHTYKQPLFVLTLGTDIRLV